MRRRTFPCLAIPLRNFLHLSTIAALRLLPQRLVPLGLLHQECPILLHQYLDYLGGNIIMVPVAHSLLYMVLPARFQVSLRLQIHHPFIFPVCVHIYCLCHFPILVCDSTNFILSFLYLAFVNLSFHSLLSIITRVNLSLPHTHGHTHSTE